MPGQHADRVGQPLVLATDLDGTFTGGEARDRETLYRSLNERPNCSLIYVTGRQMASAVALREIVGLPRPDIFITDVGSSVLPAWRDERFEALEWELGRRWPGNDAVRQCLQPLSPLIEEQPVEAARRVSFFVRDGQCLADVLPRVRDAVADLEVNVVGGDDICIDILPAGVDKGTTLDMALRWLAVDRDSVVVAGDSAGDAQLFQDDVHGIVVGDAEPQLKQLVGDRPNVYVAGRAGAAGILEGLGHFGFLKEGATP
jgi:HAD superfamily hydrolase (TIGR01484 family)